MNRRLSDPRISPILALFVTILAGCQRAEQTPPPRPVPSEAPLAAQIEEVRAGRSEAIVLEETLVTDADLDALRGLATLKELTLRNTNLSDSAAVVLSELTGLEKLILGDTTFTDN